MKKILLYIFALLVSFSFYTTASFAAGCSSTCKIQSGPAPIIEKYLANNKKIISKINSNLQTEEKKSGIGISSALVAYNNIISWDSFNNSFSFLKLNLQSEIPKEISRDYTQLKKESKNLNSFLEKIILSGYAGNSTKDICNGIVNCSLKGTNGEIIGQLIKNTDNIITYYTLSIEGKQDSFKGTIELVDNNFLGEFNNYYNKYTITDCSSCEGAYFDRVGKAIKSVSLKDKNAKEGMQEWKEAWQILTGQKNDTAEYIKKERELLQAKLSKDGVSGNTSESVLKNLDRYNNQNNAYAGGNNALNNSFTLFENGVDITGSTKLISDFGDTIAQLFGKVKDDTSASPGKGSVPLSNIVDVKTTITNTHEIRKRIDILYQREIPFIANQDLNSEKLQAKIIDIHARLSQAITILDKTIPFSEKVCNDQDRGNGKCRY